MNVDTLIEKRQDIEELLGTIAHLQNMLTDAHECKELNQCLDYCWDDLEGELRTPHHRWRRRGNPRDHSIGLRNRPAYPHGRHCHRLDTTTSVLRR